MHTKKSELKRFQKTEMHKREKNGEKKHSPYIHLFFGMGLAVICFMFLAGMSVVSAAPVITDWSNSCTNDQDTTFLVNQGDTITFSVTVNEDADYQWVVNNVDQNNNAPNFTWTVPSENGIWKIHVRATNEAEEERVLKLMEELQGYDFPKFNQEMKNALFTSQSQIEWVVSSSMSCVSSASSTLSALSSPTFTIEVKPGSSIQAAIDAVPPEGGIVKLAAGTFTVDSTIRINRSNLVLCGAGKDKTTIEMTQHKHVIQVSTYDDLDQKIEEAQGVPFDDESDCTLSNVMVKDLHVHGFTTTPGPGNYIGEGCGVIAGWVKDCTFSNLWIENTFQGLVPHKSFYTLAKDNLVENNYENWDTYGHMYATITGNTFRGAVGWSHNFKANSGCRYNLISNNIVGPGFGKLLLYGESNYCAVLNNTVHGNTDAGIQSHYSDHNIIKGNVIYGNGIGIRLSTLSGTSSVGENSGYHKVIGNVIFENDDTTRGDSQQWGIDITNVAKNEIISNTIYGNPSDGIRIGSSHCHDNVIRNNIITNNGGYGINSGTSIDNTYNNIWNDASGSYSGVSEETGDISVDPLFADPDNKDFHLKGTERRWTESGWVSDAVDSLCIDAGDPSDDYSIELVPNGERINIGAYGNTVEASASNGDPLDTTPPYTSGHSPAKNTTGVSRDTSIVVHIKDDGVGVDQSSIVMTVEGITVTPTINGTINDYNISYTPSSPFDNDQAVGVTIDARDLASPANVMSQDTYSFTIDPGDTTPPTIIAHLPTGTSVPVGTTISVTFSEAMNHTSVANAFSLSPSVIGSFSWDDNAVTFTPDSDLSYETTYAVTIDTRAEDLAGNNLEGLYTWQFTTRAFSTIVYVATDGTGDYNCDGTDDHVEINQAISYIDSIGGGTVHLKSGTYIINDAIALSSNLIFEGDGETSTTIKLKDQNNRANWAFFNGDGITNTIMQSFTVDGNDDGQSGLTLDSDIDAFRIYNSDHITFQYVTCKNFFTDHFEFYYSIDCEVVNCTSLDSHHDATRAIHCERITVADNYAYNIGNTGVRIYDSNDCVVERNRYYTRGYGIEVQGQGSGTYGGNIYRDNYLLNWLSGGAAPGVLLLAQGNTIIENEVFERNIVEHAELSGFKLFVTDSGQIRNIDIINNVVQDSKSGINVEAGTNINAKNNILVNNREYGIYGSVDSSYNNVWGNPSGNYGGGASTGTGDISVDPLFADPANEDFHLKSTEGRWTESGWVTDSLDSPCIDAGDPSSDYSSEPAPNGGRINMGAYGNTAEASRSAPTGPDTTPPYTTGHSPAKDATGVSKDTNVVVHIKDDGEGVDQSSIVMTVEGNQVMPTITGTANNYTLTYNPPSDFDYDQVVNVTIDAQDLASPPNVMTQDSYSFTMQSAPDTTSPAKVTDLATSNPTSRSIPLTWTAPGDDGDEGTATEYDVRYSTSEITEANWNSATQCTDEPTPQIAGSTETFTVTGLFPDTTYYFALKTADEVPNWSNISNCASGTTKEETYLYLWLEAEDADILTPDFEIASDASASNGKYIQIPEGVGFRAHDGEATYNISINTSGNYVVWGIKIAATGGDNSFFVQIDDGTEYLWALALSDNWQWDAVNHWGSGGEFDPEIDPVVFTLSAGEHTLKIIQREDGAKLDKLLITNDMSYVPALNNPPTAFIDSIAPDPAEQGKDTVSFTGHGTDTDGSVVAYNWRSSIDGLLSTASSFSKPASELSVGTHTIYFKVQDDDGAWSTEITEDLRIIEPANQAPVSDPNGPYTGTEGVPIAYDGSGSYDLDGSIVAYEWDFGDGNNATGVTPTHTYTQNGTYTVTLTVTDKDGATDTSTTTATIADTEPTADFSATPTRGQKPLTVAFSDNSTSYDGIVAWEWDFDNDGVTDSTEQNPTYEYTEEGVYTVSLKVSESDGDSDTTTKTDYITVTKINNAPYKPANPSPSGGAADVSVDADLSWTGGDPDAGDTVTYDVYFGTTTTPLLVAENQMGTTYDPGTLDHSTEYYWQIVATDNHGAMTEGGVWAFTTAAAQDTPPIVSNPSATPDTILNDNGRPRIPGTNISQLSVTVTDDTEVDTVTIDLSPIGGSYEAQMTNIPGTDTWTITMNAVEGINIAHDLIVTATDISGNFNNTVSITLTVLRRSDVFRDNIVDMKDVVYITRYLAGLEPERSNPPSVVVGDVVGSGGDPTGDGIVNMKDAVYIARYKAGWEDEP